jgi:hypothetical protein
VPEAPKIARNSTRQSVLAATATSLSELTLVDQAMRWRRYQKKEDDGEKGLCGLPFKYVVG